MTSSNKKSRTTTRPNQKGKRGSNSKKTMSPPKESSTLTIILTNVNAYDILLNHYGDLEKSPKPHDIQETIVDFGNEDVGIVDLLHEKSKKSKRSVSFLDPHKGQVKLWGVMIDLTSMGPLPRYTSKPCWWCRNKFSHHPIGCPVRYNTQKEKGIYKDRVEERFTELNLPLEDGNDFFETEGLFCTFPCVKAYIIDQISRTGSPKYKKSLTLLTLLYLKLTGEVSSIPVAGTWKLTMDWGGHMTPQEYRASSGMLEYKETVNTRRPYMFCSSNWIREKRVK